MLNRETRLYEQRLALPSPLFDQFGSFTQMSACFIENGHIAGGETAAVRENATPATRTRHPSIQAQRMPRNADGSSSHNMFGIKAGDEWRGARAVADTMEVVDGVATPRRTTFRSYGSIEESVNDFMSLMKNSPRYRDVVAAGGSAAAYIAGMGKSGYATDPEYANKLNQILHSDTLQSAVAARIAAL